MKTLCSFRACAFNSDMECLVEEGREPDGCPFKSDISSDRCITKEISKDE